jgi:unsaturated rhamnogalacturonyl hydrolase
MQYSKRFLTAIILLCLSLSARAFAAEQANSISRDENIDRADNVADSQLRLLKNTIDSTWIGAVLQAGLADYSAVSPKGDSYIKVLTDLSEKSGWKPGVAPKHVDLFHADDLAIGQTYLDLYAIHPDPARIDPLRARLDQVVDHLNVEFKTNGKLTWWWCDALFMAPPVMTRVSAITGDRKYIDAMDREYWRAAAALYSPDDHLFYRDARFVNKPDKNGRKVFWARGNGWVVGGLARTLQYMPENYPSRGKYVVLFKDMMSKLLTLQTADGTWHSNLLYPDDVRGPEASGTAFITYAMAWGINNKLLSADQYEPAAVKGWNALNAHLTSDGIPGYVQGTGYQPGAAKPEGTQLYATGAFLMAAVELQKLAPLAQPAGN